MSSSDSRRSCRSTDQDDIETSAGSSLRGNPGSVRQLEVDVRLSLSLSLSLSLMTLLGARPAIVKLGGRYDPLTVKRSSG